MDIAYSLDGLVPAAIYQGSLTDNTEAAYDAIVWQDSRPKPTLVELQTYWDSDVCKNKLATEAFNVEIFQSDLAFTLPSLSNPNLRWEFAALDTYATNEDLSGMTWYMNMLYAGGVATLADIEAVNALLTKQGIIL